MIVQNKGCGFWRIEVFAGDWLKVERVRKNIVNIVRKS